MEIKVKNAIKYEINPKNKYLEKKQRNFGHKTQSLWIPFKEWSCKCMWVGGVGSLFEHTIGDTGRMGVEGLRSLGKNEFLGTVCKGVLNHHIYTKCI